MIVGWIRSSIEPRVRSTVTFITEAYKLWENLKKRFEVGNKVRIHQLMEQLASCRQNGQAVIDYYGKLAMMWEELQTYKPPPACSCSAAIVYEKEREDERVHQFIMGLDESRFGNVMTAIIEADELPDLGKAYAKVIKEEARLSSAKAREAVPQEAIGFMSRREGQTDACDTSNNSAFGNRARDRLCSHCGKTGHEKNNCWQIIGYPEWMNEKRGRGSGRGRGGSSGGSTAGRGGRGYANTAHATSAYGAGGPDLTPEQWKAITQIINDGKTGGQSEKLSGKSLGDVIIDSGASHHMTGDISQLVGVREIPPCVVGFADGGTSTSCQMGDLILSDKISLKAVLFVPSLDCTLISVSKLLKHSNCCALFTDTIVVLQDRSLKTLIGAGEERDGVYFFRDVRVGRANRADGNKDQLLWHRRRGHPAFAISSSLPMLSGVLNKACSSPCDVCFRAKQIRDVFNDSINKTSHCFELIHVDVWGPY